MNAATTRRSPGVATGPCFWVTMVVLAVGLAVGGSANADDWRRLHKSGFPARVGSISFGAHVMEAGAGVVWGKWAVSFGGAQPVATWRSDCMLEDDLYIHCIEIEPLACRNDIVGTKPCRLTLARSPLLGDFCNLWIQGDRIRITCPRDLAVH